MSDESDKILDNLTNAAQRFTHFLQDNFPKECVEGEYATDTAIRILASLQTQKDIDEVTIKGLLQANNHKP